MKLTEMTQSRILQPSASIVVPSIVVEEEEIPLNERMPWYKCGCCRGRAALPERPLLRTDLYYTGSLTQLDEFTTKVCGRNNFTHLSKVHHRFSRFGNSRSYINHMLMFGLIEQPKKGKDVALTRHYYLNVLPGSRVVHHLTSKLIHCTIILTGL